MAQPWLEAQNVSKAYTASRGMFRGTQKVMGLSGVSLTLGRGEVLGLVGESGCGKSTLANILLGLLRPTAGHILFEGRDIAHRSRRELGRMIQPVFQDPYSSLNPRRTVEQIITAPLRIHGIGDAASRHRKAAEYLELVNLPQSFLGKYPNALSGGQRQRVSIARALIIEPRVLICDEPTSALDVSVQSQIINLLMDLKQRLDLSYLFISHDLGVVRYVADRVAVMYFGQVVEEAPSADLFSSPAHPYTRALIDSVLTPQPGLGLTPSTIGSEFPDPMNPPPGCLFHPRCPRAVESCSTNVQTRKYAGPRSVRCERADLPGAPPPSEEAAA